MITNTKKSMDVLDVHKSKAKTSIARIGTMTFILDFLSFCINMDLIITAITTANSPLPILHQFLMKFIRLINNTEWACWCDGSQVHMPQIHWHCYSFLQTIFNHVADFATDFGNINIVSENQPISELNIQPLVHAITTLRAFEDNIILHQSLGTPIVPMTSSIKAYTLNPWNKTDSCNKFSPDALPQANNSGPNPTHQRKLTDRTSAGDKRNTTTPKGGVKPSPVQRQKKQRRAVANDTVKRAQLDMGMFWLHNPKIRNSKIFPRDLPDRV
jgi:hypothetical protein